MVESQYRFENVSLAVCVAYSSYVSMTKTLEGFTVNVKLSLNSQERCGFNFLPCVFLASLSFVQ